MRKTLVIVLSWDESTEGDQTSVSMTSVKPGGSTSMSSGRPPAAADIPELVARLLNEELP